jgi:hypothetical protein
LQFFLKPVTKYLFNRSNKKQHMKRYLISVVLLIAGFTTIDAQKNIHDANAISRTVSSFHGIQVSAGIDLYLSQSNTEGLAVSASSTEYRDKIITEVENGVLKIYYGERGSWGSSNWGNRKMKAYVSAKNIDLLEASGGSDVFIDENLKVAKLKVQLSGGSDMIGKLEVEDLIVGASGGSDAKLSGTVNHLKVSISGGSDFKGADLFAENCSISASGGSDAYIHVNKELESHASGGSDIRYTGNPATRNTSSGEGTVKKRS